MIQDKYVVEVHSAGRKILRSTQLQYIQSKIRETFRKILRPSQNT